MKKFFTGIILGMLITLYIIKELGSGLSGNLPAKPTEPSLQEARQNEVYRENVRIINKQPEDITIPDSGSKDSTVTEKPGYDTSGDIPEHTGSARVPNDYNESTNTKLVIADTQIIEKADDLPHYQMNLIGPGGKKDGSVLISSDSSVWCDLKTLAYSMGWELNPDGSVYSTAKEHHLLFKIDPQTMASAKNSIYVSLSYLKKMWLLDFSFNPINHTLELS